MPTKFGSTGILKAAFSANLLERGAARIAKLHPVGIFYFTNRTVHQSSRSAKFVLLLNNGSGVHESQILGGFITIKVDCIDHCEIAAQRALSLP
jgi:hypothetical protein